MREMTVIPALIIVGSVLLAYTPSLHCSKVCPDAAVNITASLKPGWKHTIESPGFPDNYPLNVTCLWRITGPSGYNLHFLIKHFEIEPSNECDNDYLLSASSEWLVRWTERGQCSVLSDNYINSLSPQQFTGNSKLIYYESDELWLKFRSDTSSSFKGFQGEVRVVAPKANSNCDNYLNASSGSLASPKYPSSYLPRQWCTWHIAVPHGSKVQLTFTDFNLENTKNEQDDCVNDYVEIREGVWGRYGTILGRFCGDVIPPKVTSPTNQMWVRFNSDRNASTVYRGFKAEFKNGSIMTTCTVFELWLTLMMSWLCYQQFS